MLHLANRLSEYNFYIRGIANIKTIIKDIQATIIVHTSTIRPRFYKIIIFAIRNIV